MARADFLIKLVHAERQGDRTRFRSLVEAVITDERAKSHHLVAERLAEALSSNGADGDATRRRHPGGADGPGAVPYRDSAAAVDGSTDRRAVRSHPGGAASTAEGLLHGISPLRRLSELTLPESTAAAVRGLVDEHHRCDLLFSYNLEPRHRVLLSGPPGNGKTSLAEALASEAMLPLYTARYESIVSSFLGESASRLDAVFEFARQRRCVLFFDEFDTIAKERADRHETGEIKRLVSTLLLQIDNLPCHVIVIVATNHQELLDRAAWRRFQLRLRLDAPTPASAVEFLQSMQTRLGGDLGLAPGVLAERLQGASYSDLEQFCLDVRRSHVLGLPDADLAKIADTTVTQWQTQARSSS